MINPIRAYFQAKGWSNVEAAKQLKIPYENLHRIMKGLPVQLPDSFQLALLKNLGLSVQAVDALNAAYVEWRNGPGAA